MLSTIALTSGSTRVVLPWILCSTVGRSDAATAMPTPMPIHEPARAIKPAR